MNGLSISWGDLKTLRVVEVEIVTAFHKIAVVQNLSKLNADLDILPQLIDASCHSTWYV